MKQYLLIVYLVSTCVVTGWQGMVFPLALVMAGILLARLPLARLGRAVLIPAILILFLSAILLIWVKPVTALMVGIRLLCVMLAFYLISAVTGCISSLDGLISGFKMRKATALNIVLIWHFIPLFRHMLKEAEETAAYRVLEKRGGGLIPLLIPVLSAAAEETRNLKIAMQRRGYDAGGDRSRVHPLQFKKEDYYAMTGMAVYVLVLLFI